MYSNNTACHILAMYSNNTVCYMLAIYTNHTVCCMYGNNTACMPSFKALWVETTPDAIQSVTNMSPEDASPPIMLFTIPVNWQAPHVATITLGVRERG